MATKKPARKSVRETRQLKTKKSFPSKMKAAQKPKLFRHPELKKGEMFLMNISSESYTEHAHGRFLSGTMIPFSETIYDTIMALGKNLSQIGFKTKRLGSTAYYMATGKLMVGFRPVFVTKAEFKKNKQRNEKEHKKVLPKLQKK